MGDLRSERAILGAFKKDRKLIDDFILPVEVFSDLRLRAVYTEMLSMHMANVEINDISFCDHIKNKPEIKPSTFIELECFTSANIEYYIDIVKKNYAIEKLRILGLEINDRVKELDPGALLEFIDKYLTDMNLNRGKKIITNQDFILNNVKSLEERREKKINKTIKTGVDLIDEKIGGWDKGTINVIASRPSIGKSALMLFMAYEIAKRNPVGLFSLEMTQEQIHDRVTSMSSGVELFNIRNGNLLQREFSLCLEGLRKLYDRTLYFDDTAYIRYRELKSKIRQMVRLGVQVVFVDYLTLIKYSVRGVPRYERVGMLCKELKKIASENNIVLIVLSQLNREAEGHEPSLANMRQSGECEEDVDSIILLNRERDSDELEINIAKNRHGPIGKVKIKFERTTGRFIRED